MNKRIEVRKIWHERVIDFKTSGLTMNRWCEDNGIKLSTLQYWIRKFKDSSTESSQVNWVAVNFDDYLPTIITSDSENNKPEITIRIGKCCINVHPDFDSQLLQDVIKVLNTVC